METKLCAGCGSPLEAEFDICAGCDRILKQARHKISEQVKSDYLARKIAVEIADETESREYLQHEAEREHMKRVSYWFGLIGWGGLAVIALFLYSMFHAR